MPSAEIFQRNTNEPHSANMAQPSAVTDELRKGSQTVREAFLKAPVRFAGSKTVLLGAGAAHPWLLIRSGFAIRCCVLADGRRAILDLLIPGDIVGLDHFVTSKPMGEVIGVSRIAYHALEPNAVDELAEDRSVLRYVLARTAEARWRSDRLSVMLGRLDAEARIAALCLDIHDRLRQRGLADTSSFELPLTQEQIADHLGLTLVHVNRTCRRLREQGMATITRQAVVIHDMERMRTLVRGLPQQELHTPEIKLPKFN